MVVNTGMVASMSQPESCTRGEYVFTQEQTVVSASGSSRRSRTTGTRMVASLGLLRLRGWIAGKAGKAWDWAANAAQTAASVVSDPTGTLGKLVNGIAAQIPGAGGMLELAKSMGGKILDGAVEAFAEARRSGYGRVRR